MANPIHPFLSSQGVLVLDGGLATELGARGVDLASDLWSASALLDAPEIVRRVHRDYLDAGADCIITATYQASEEGLRRRGLTGDEARALMGRAVTLAIEVRDTWWRREDRPLDRLRPLVAASVGPFGAARADGSEYTGAYGVDRHTLATFHRPRLALLAACGADLLACETIPSLPEARVLARLLAATGSWAWISFQCRDDRHLADGTPLDIAVAAVADLERLVAVGVNCVAARWVPGLIDTLSQITELPLVVYPNTGTYDLQSKTWSDGADAHALADVGTVARRRGARLIGGCCNTGPADIRSLRRALLAPGEQGP